MRRTNQFAVRKPDELHPIVEACSSRPYLELFARHPRAGWTSWGNEVDEAPIPPKPVEERVGQLILLEQRRNYRTKRKTS